MPICIYYIEKLAQAYLSTKSFNTILDFKETIDLRSNLLNSRLILCENVKCISLENFTSLKKLSLENAFGYLN